MDVARSIHGLSHERRGGRVDRAAPDIRRCPAARDRRRSTALAQVSSTILFKTGGLGERIPRAALPQLRGLPGTADDLRRSIAHFLGRPYRLVACRARSLWWGRRRRTLPPFASARERGSVSSRRRASRRASTSVGTGFQRESNTIVGTAQELEWYNGVVIFATNLAANFDPAFERRIRTHVLFEMPGEAERAQIWPVQLHPTRTPLAADVDFQALARRYEVSGGDIRNAVLKAALAAAAEPGPDSAKRIHQRHFEASIEEVIAGRRVMRQSLFAGEPLVLPEANLVAGATASHASPLVANALAGAALLLALIALAVALLT